MRATPQIARPSNAGRILVLGLTVLALLGASTSAWAAAVSSNWAGYVVKSHVSFERVVGAWTQPAAVCTGQATHSAFWVGLGGYSRDSTKLEQTGTEADCTATGRPCTEHGMR